MRASGLALAGVAGIVAARALGAAGYGTYSWAYALALALAIPAGLGADQLLTREAGVAQDRGEWGRLRALVRSVLGRVSLVSVAVATLGAAAILAVNAGDPDARGTALLVALPLVPLAVAVAVAQGALLSLGRTTLALGPGMLLRPALFLGLVAIAAAAGTLSATGAVALQLVALAVAASIALTLLGRTLAARSARAEIGTPARDPRTGTSPREWLRISVPMGAAAMLLVVEAQVGLFVLGAVGHAADTGVYAAALQCTAPFVLLVTAGRLPLGPVIARLRASGERERLQRGLRVATRGVGAVSAVVAVTLLAIPGTVLGLFGSEFSVGADTLRLLAVAQLVNALCAFNGLVLIMGGHERTAMRTALGCLTLDVVLCLILVPPLGELGAAIGVTASITTRNVVNSLMVRRLLGVDATVIGRMPAPRRGATRR